MVFIMKNDGKATEKLFDSYFKSVMACTPEFVYYRFVDSSLARNIVQSQPSDRLVVYKGMAILVEIKSSVDPVRFPLKNISKKQVGYGRRWVMAGARSVFIIHNILTDEFYFVPLSEVNSKINSRSASWKWEELAKYKKESYTWKFW